MSEMTTTTTKPPEELTENDSNNNSTASKTVPPLFDEEYEAMFMSLLDFSPKPKVKYDGPPQSETFAKLALAYYKETKGEDYQLLKIRSMMPFPPRQGRSQGGTHLNFFARPRSSDPGPEYLFYGELEHRPINPQVVDCFKFPLGTDDGVDFIVHPPHIICPDCDYIGRYELDDYDDFE
ncbi:uncharacterized protein LOC141656205 [Silene latifolia]|uniref:uncharacterized protein LOC141656205 n=1 Tax=Silene latifolia TaxID=37657 RepID=UPI003D772116